VTFTGLSKYHDFGMFERIDVLLRGGFQTRNEEI